MPFQCVSMSIIWLTFFFLCPLPSITSRSQGGRREEGLRPADPYCADPARLPARLSSLVPILRKVRWQTCMRLRCPVTSCVANNHVVCSVSPVGLNCAAPYRTVTCLCASFCFLSSHHPPSGIPSLTQHLLGLPCVSLRLCVSHLLMRRTCCRSRDSD